MSFSTKIFFLVLCFYTSTSFKIFDAEPMLQKSPKINLTAAQLEKILRVEEEVPDYTTLKFEHENAQFAGQYDIVYERCQTDHIKCLITTLTSINPVCGVNVDGKNMTAFGSVCDLYLENCEMREDYWAVAESGNCQNVDEVYVYTDAPTTTTTTTTMDPLQKALHDIEHFFTGG